MEIRMISPANSWLLIVGLTLLLVAILLLADRAVDDFDYKTDKVDIDDWSFDHADDDLGI
jgi:hypothetical protein